jgi:hypothetical protein
VPVTGLTHTLMTLGTYDDGTGPNLFAGTSPEQIGAPAYLVRWNGVAWSIAGSVSLACPSCFAFVSTLAVRNDGSGSTLFVGGHFDDVGGVPAQNIASWNGSSFSPLGSGLNYASPALAVFDDGSGPALFAGCAFNSAGGVAANRIAKWDGSSWSPLGSGVGGTESWNCVYALSVFDDGTGGGPDLYVGGAFHVAGGSPSYNLAVWEGCAGPGTLFCAGAGSPTVCPCGNSGSDQHGCENSASTGGGLLSSSGSTSPDTVVLHSSGETPTAPSIFLQGDASITPVSFGDGLRCVSGVLKRLYVKPASGGVVSAPGAGDPSISARSAALGDPIAPGTTRTYQTYYRDPVAGFCAPPAGSTFNVTNGLRIVW